MYPTHCTSRMGIAKVKQEQEADTRIIVKEWYEIWKERIVGTIRGESPKQDLTSAKELSIEFPE